jgi:hypothetical protein
VVASRKRYGECGGELKGLAQDEIMGQNWFMYTVFHENDRMVATWKITQLLSDDVAGLSASIVAVSLRVCPAGEPSFRGVPLASC